MGLRPVSVFAYPYGDYNDSIEGMVKSSGYMAGRGTDRGFNTKNTDLYVLNTQNILNDTTLAQVKTWISQAEQNKTWLILVFHNVDLADDTYSISPEILQAILSYLKQANIKVVTTEQALNFMK